MGGPFKPGFGLSGAVRQISSPRFSPKPKAGLTSRFISHLRTTTNKLDRPLGFRSVGTTGRWPTQAWFSLEWGVSELDREIRRNSATSVFHRFIVTSNLVASSKGADHRQSGCGARMNSGTQANSLFRKILPATLTRSRFCTQSST